MFELLTLEQKCDELHTAWAAFASAQHAYREAAFAVDCVEATFARDGMPATRVKLAALQSATYQSWMRKKYEAEVQYRLAVGRLQTAQLRAGVATLGRGEPNDG